MFAVHLLGIPCDMKAIMAIAAEHGLKVIEDCAQSMDCTIDGQHVGTFGDFGCFSFHAAKTMTTLGEGGMFVVKDPEIARAVPGVRHNGLTAIPGAAAFCQLLVRDLHFVLNIGNSLAVLGAAL